MAYYQIPNNVPSQFSVIDPFAELQEEVAQLEVTVASLSGAVQDLIQTPGGELLYLNLSMPWNNLPVEQFVPLGSKMLQTKMPSLTGAQTVTVPANNTYEMYFLTSPSNDMFDNNVEYGTWTAILHTQSTATGCLIAATVEQLSNFNGQLVFNNLVDTERSNNEDFQQVTLATGTDVQTHYIPIPVHFEPNPTPTSTYYIMLLLVNNSDNDAEVTLYTGVEYPSRIRTTLHSLPTPKTFAWAYEFFDYDGFINPVQGRFFVTENFDSFVPVNDFFDGESFAMTWLYSETAYILKINGTSLMGANVSNWFRNNQDDTMGIQINNAYDSSNFFIGEAYWFYDYLFTYNGYRMLIKRTYLGYDCSINRIFIYSCESNTQPTWGFSTNTGNDYWDIYTGDFSNPSTVCYSVVYNNTTDPVSFVQMLNYFKYMVDAVLNVNGFNTTTVVDMQQAFNENYAYLRNALPETFKYFEFVDWGGLTQDETSGSGVDFEANLAGGRTYFPEGAHYGDTGINQSGNGYQVGDTIRIYGTQMDGATPANDAYILVTEVDSNGGVQAYQVTGTAAYLHGQDSIADGGDDQYDDGNYLSTNYTSDMSYGYGVQQDNVYADGSQMIIDYNDGIFVMFATNCSSNSDFQVGGVVGADGDGFVDVESYEGYYFYMDSQDAANGLLEQSQVYNFSFTSHSEGFTAPNPLRAASKPPKPVRADPSVKAAVDAKRQVQLDAHKAKVAAKPKSTRMNKGQVAKQEAKLKAQAAQVAVKTSHKKNDIKDVKAHFEALKNSGVKSMLIPKKAPEPKVRKIEPKVPPKIHAELLQPQTSVPMNKRR